MMKTTEYFETFNKVFDSWNENQVLWCIVRNYEFLAEKQFYEGGDLDVLVRKEHVDTAQQVLLKTGFIRLVISPFSPHRAYVKYVPECQRMISIHFHIDDVHGPHLAYFPGNQLFSRRKKIKNYFVPDDCDYYCLLLLHCILNKGTFTEKYIDRIKKLVKKCRPQEVEKRLTFALGERWAKVVSSRSDLTPHINRIKRYFQLRSFHRYMWITYGSCAWGLTKVFAPCPLVSIIGMDGAGKTTVTQNIEEIFKKSLVKCTVLYTGRGKGNVLPIQAIGRRVKTKVDRAENNGESRWTKVLRTMAAPVFALDLWVRYWFKIFPKRMRMHIVITDRYASDILLMKHVPQFLKNLLFLVMPKASETVYLYNKPEVLHKRKPDHDLEDLKRQEKLFETIVAKTHATKVLSDTPEKTLNKVMEIVINKLK